MTRGQGSPPSPPGEGPPPTHPGEGGFLERLAVVPVVAILRAADAGRFLEVGRVLYEGGVRAIEVTLTSAGALDAFGRLAEELPGDAMLGVGTVRSAADAEAAVAAGAAYLVAPDFHPDMVAFAVQRGVPVVPGGLTPTEIAAAWAAGATAVKVFPVSAVGGPAYLRAVGAPLPEVPLVPTGGVGLGDIGAYLAAGAAAVGIGSPLLGDAGDPGGDLDALADRARRAVAAATS
ncbi:MAG: 2-dehydro-3-deoxyphosphogluconate aldolase [Actinomycetia bacterium]|jgi:2-dehydro-3-deoxyphosphogluconate aldolase/(4S)-4-hydroxy-2-oxoglutarate aldolase|nr:2-dehydro-3-deoxyphosphogluconate aldolase [Actinomycetes bacterium]